MGDDDKRSGGEAMREAVLSKIKIIGAINNFEVTGMTGFSWVRIDIFFGLKVRIDI